MPFPTFIATADVTESSESQCGAELPDPPQGRWGSPGELVFHRDLGIPYGTGGCLESWDPSRS